MNESKSRPDSPQWAKWRASGAIGTIETARLSQIQKSLGQEGLPITAMGIDHQLNRTTLSLGEEPINEWATKPIAYVVVPGRDHELGEIIIKLPKGSQSLQAAFPRKK